MNNAIILLTPNHLLYTIIILLFRKQIQFIGLYNIYNMLIAPTTYFTYIVYIKSKYRSGADPGFQVRGGHT